jgi:BASS family bile acid:Na+ symporter
VITAVILHNILGIGIGLAVSRLFGFNLRQSQTIAIEVGMQNSGLGVALALQHFSATAALPGALFSIWHNLSGSFLATRWARKRGSIDEAIKDAYGKQ